MLQRSLIFWFHFHINWYANRKRSHLKTRVLTLTCKLYVIKNVCNLCWIRHLEFLKFVLGLASYNIMPYTTRNIAFAMLDFSNVIFNV